MVPPIKKISIKSMKLIYNTIMVLLLRKEQRQSIFHYSIAVSAFLLMGLHKISL